MPLTRLVTPSAESIYTYDGAAAALHRQAAAVSPIAIRIRDLFVNVKKQVGYLRDLIVNKDNDLLKHHEFE